MSGKYDQYKKNYIHSQNVRLNSDFLAIINSYYNQLNEVEDTNESRRKSGGRKDIERKF